MRFTLHCSSLLLVLAGSGVLGFLPCSTECDPTAYQPYGDGQL